MNKETILEEIKKGKDEIRNLQEQMRNKIKANFHELAKTVFNEYPELKSFGWTQYTPYFNDGEECVFSSNHDDPFINGFDSWTSSDEPGDCWGYFDNGQDEGAENIYGKNREYKEKIYGELPDGGRCEIDNPDYNPRNGEIVKSVKDFLNVFDEQDYKDMFGDHVSVIVTPDWVESQELEHD